MPRVKTLGLKMQDCGKKFMIPKERNNTLISNEAHGFLATFPALLLCEHSEIIVMLMTMNAIDINVPPRSPLVRVVKYSLVSLVTDLNNKKNVYKR